MSDNYSLDVYYRLLTIISLLTETEEGMTINELSERLKVGKSTIINDLRNLQLIAEFNMSIGPADFDLEEYWDDKDTEIREEEDNKFLLALYEGTRNDVPLKIIYLKRDECFSVELTAFERLILTEYLKKHNMDDIMPNKREIYIKTLAKTDYSIYAKLSKINDAIRKEKAIEIKVINECSKKVDKLVIYPLKVVSLFLDSEYYVVAICDNANALYNIGNIKEINSTNRALRISSELKTKILEEYEYRWGIGANEGIIEFELKVYNEADLFNRLQKRLSSRKHGKWVEYGDYAIYTDKVIDYNALKQWVMSYGSSVRVIKPQRLADDIVKSAEERLRKYNALIHRKQV